MRRPGQGQRRTGGSEQRGVCLVASSGGHLTQLMPLEPWWSHWRRTWVTFKTQDAVSLLQDEDVVWAHHPTTRHLGNLARNFAVAVRVLRRTRPDLVVSTGAGVAVPFFVVAKVLGIPTIYIEVYDRLETPTMTARLCRPITSLFCVQWDEQQSLYRDAHVIGTLL